MPVPTEAPQKVNILLVDDQPGKLLTYETMLEQLDQNLVKVTSGEQALQLLLKTEFAIVLLDVCMPQLDGFELATLIRQHPRCKHTAIIFISAVQMSDADRQRGYAMGAVDYVSVPVVPELLRARVGVFADLYRKTVALERMNQELEARVAERTAALERDLAERRRLEEALVKADRRKDEFLAVLAHELRNPLAPIQTAVDTMRLRPLQDAVLQECRDIVGRQVEQMTRLVNDLMDVSRITRGTITLQRRPLEIAEVVRRAVETTKPMLDAHRHELILELPAESMVVQGDLTRLSETVGNLLNNAAKYTEERGHVSLRVVPVQRSQGDEVQIRVRDDGVGIPPEMLATVFDMFTQVDDSLHRAQGGLGIGLALVRELAEMHGGRVEAHSEGLGRGSEFILTLPLRRDLQVPAPAQAGGAQVGLAAGACRILVVDDNRDAAQSLAAMLRLGGSQVEAVHDGTEALLLAERFRPDVVLLDIGMPGMNGFDVARKIRARPWGASVTLVAQTGWGQERDRERARAAGFDAHMTKPVEHRALMKLLAERRPGWERLAEAR